MNEVVDFLTIGDVARRFACQPWQVRRLFERGLLPPAARGRCLPGRCRE